MMSASFRQRYRRVRRCSPGVQPQVKQRSRRGTVAVELMILGPVIAMISLVAGGLNDQPELLWATCAVLSVYVLYRFGGDLTRSR